jgi:hypothetical protein
MMCPHTRESTCALFPLQTTTACHMLQVLVGRDLITGHSSLISMFGACLPCLLWLQHGRSLSCTMC